EWSLKTWLAPWSYVASVAYHDMFWYPRFAKEKMAPVLESDWGRLFANWGKVPSNDRGFPNVGEPNAELIQIGAKHFAEGMRLIGMAVAESPEMNARKRRKQAAENKSTYY
ncbi:MAG: Ferredoxin, partial [Myxococcaceae bacterium]|nr:Ferredoxin [Myxococcaceae bacterium]